MSNNLKKFREDRLMTQRELAKKSGVSARTIQYAEGLKQTPQVVTKFKLVRGLGLPWSDVATVFPCRD